MRFKNYNVYFFFFVLIGISILTFFVVKPFIVSFLVAGILAHFFAPVYRFFLKRFKGNGLSALLTCLLVALIIVIPLLTVLSLVVNEIQYILDGFNQHPDVLKNNLIDFKEKLSNYPLFKNFGTGGSEELTFSGLKNFSQNILALFQGIYSGLAHFVFVTFIMFFSLFYLLIDGSKLVEKIMLLSPLQEKHERTLVEKFNSITRATIKGTTFIAVLQGFLSGILFFATGTPSPVLLGILTIIASTIPSVGSGLIWFPVGLLMILFGHVGPGIVILVGGLFISTIDNFIRPKLVGKDTQMHPLLILFSTLGGIVLFGISGFIIGPIVMSLFVALWDIYALEFRNQLEEYN